MIFDKPLSEYVRSEANISISSQVRRTKCLLWLPEKGFEEPHLYLLFDTPSDLQFFEKYSHEKIDVQIDMTDLGFEEVYSSYVVKKAHFEYSSSRYLSKNWFEGLIKYSFPSLATIIHRKSKQESIDNRFVFQIADSRLLKSAVAIEHNYTGEVKREVVDAIILSEEVKHLGIMEIKTDRYIGSKEASILEITTSSKNVSFLTFYKRIKIVSEFILMVTSFAERRRLSWHKNSGYINGVYTEIYNTRTTFFSDKESVMLISQFAFKDYLKTVLQNTTAEDLKYKSRLLRRYISGVDYSINAKIVLWNSILETVLKRHYNCKNDTKKEELLNKFGIYIGDLGAFKDLIDIRNDVAHGDDVVVDKIFELYYLWQILIERVILRELGWNDLSKTDVAIDGVKPYGI